MNAERLLALYEQVAEAPDAVARLRRFVLDLGVRGKLVPQEPGDEPASELLKRIAAARADAPKSGRNGKKKLVDPSLTDLAFDLPGGWSRTRLSELVRVVNGRAYKKPELLDEGTPVLRVGNLFTSDHWYYSNLQLEDDKYCDKGDLIYAWSASFGPFIWDGPRVIYHYHIWKLPLFSESDLDKQFLYLFLQQKTREIKDAGHGISMVHMTKEKMEQLAVPLPPLAEQRRIVAQVEELMALLDRLEAARTAREATRDRLTAASLARLTASDTMPDADAPGALPAEVGTGSASGKATNKDSFPANARFALATLPALTTRPDQIKPLRQTILNLAVRGKLVDQDPTDEPASDLLKRIAKRRRGLAAEEGVRKKKPVEPLAEEDELGLPANWAADAFANLIDPRATISYGVLVPGPDVDEGVPFVRAQDLTLADHPAKPSKTIAPEVEAKYARTRLSGGEILLCVVGSIGKLGIAPQHWAGANIARAVARIAPVDLLDRDYLLLFLRSDRAQGYFEEATRTLAQPTLNVGLIEKLPVPLPPLAEQHRIVAKVDALMALCDRLEAALTTTDTTRARLIEALLHEALDPATNAITEAAE